MSGVRISSSAQSYCGAAVRAEAIGTMALRPSLPEAYFSRNRSCSASSSLGNHRGDFRYAIVAYANYQRSIQHMTNRPLICRRNLDGGVGLTGGRAANQKREFWPRCCISFALKIISSMTA